MQNCKMQKCKNAKMQKCKNAKCKMQNAKCKKCKQNANASPAAPAPRGRNREQSPPRHSVPATDLTHARTHERNETISRLGQHKVRRPPNLRLLPIKPRKRDRRLGGGGCGSTRSVFFLLFWVAQGGQIRKVEKWKATFWKSKFEKWKVKIFTFCFLKTRNSKSEKYHSPHIDFWILYAIESKNGCHPP